MMPAWRYIGAHRYYVEGNLFVMELNGAVTLQEMTELLLPQEALLEQYERVLTLAVSNQDQIPSSDIRKFLAQRGQRVDIDRLHVVAVIKSQLQLTILRLIERATALLAKTQLHNTFVHSEAEAWQWIEEQRRQHLPKLRVPK